VEAGHDGDALPLGLLCRILFDPGAADDRVAIRAAERLAARFLGGHAVSAAAGRQWADAAELVVTGLTGSHGAGEVHRRLDRADTLAGELDLGDRVEASRHLPGSFERRLARLAQALEAVAAAPGEAAPADLEPAIQSVTDHAQAAVLRGRYDAALMATRLARWLAAPAPAPAATLAEAIDRYTHDTAFADRARRHLLRGDQAPVLSAAYGALARQARARREAESQRFAGLLQAWLKAPPQDDPTLTVEAVLDRVVAPLARQRPVLLLVLDGLSLPVFVELLPPLLDQGWNELWPAGAERRPAALAALPTITAVSRASLLTGRPVRGAQPLEKTAFAGHAGLRVAYKTRKAPRLWHKGDLTGPDGPGLAADLRATLADPADRVVGVVYNAIDDHLAGSDQLHQTWAPDVLPPLPALLHEARAAGRVVILTADHGHVLDEATVLRAQDGDGGDRWRPADAPPGDGEVLLQGARVLAPDGSDRVVAAWSEAVRHAGKKTGYHGGAAPQEAIVPACVLSPVAEDLDGWHLAPPVEPGWWHGGEPAPAPRRPAPRPPRPRDDRQPGLFDAPRPATPPAGWIDRLLASRTYDVQRRMAGARSVGDEQVRALLAALAERDGLWPFAALAQRLGDPPFRLNGRLAQVRRLLNVDGYPVLTVDDPANTVTLNRDLLEVQFGLKDA